MRGQISEKERQISENERQISENERQISENKGQISRIMDLIQKEKQVTSFQSPEPYLGCYLDSSEVLLGVICNVNLLLYGTVSSKITLLEFKFYHYKNCTLRKATYLHNGFIFSFQISYTCSHISSLCANRFWCSRYFPCHGYKGL